MVVDVRLLGVVRILIRVLVVVAVDEQRVVMRMRMPQGPVLPFPQRPTHTATVVVRNMVVVMPVHHGQMRMRRSVPSSGPSQGTGPQALGCTVGC